MAVPLQVFVQVVDGGGRRSTATGQININVLSNETPPRFIDYEDFPITFPFPYSTTISYTINVPATRVIAVRAVDSDAFSVVRYKLRTDALTERYFTIDPVTGVINLVDSLQNGEVSSRTQFNVSLFFIIIRTSNYEKKPDEFKNL